MAKAPKAPADPNEEPKPKRTRGPRKAKGPQLEAADYDDFHAMNEAAYVEEKRKGEAGDDARLLRLIKRREILAALRTPATERAGEGT